MRHLSPKNLPNLELFLWAKIANSMYTSTAETTQSTNTSAVGRWKDLSGNNRHCDQATAGFKPTLQTTGMNSRPSVRFDGSDDVLASPAFTIPEPSTICVVAYSTAAGYYVDGATTLTRVLYLASGATVGAYAGINITTAIGATGTARFYLAGFTGGVTSIIRQNATEATGDAGTATETAGLTVGSAIGSFCNGDIAAVLVYSRLLAIAERDFLYHFFKQDYGL